MLNESYPSHKTKGVTIQECPPPVFRKLKIEANGDQWKGIKPKIRLMGGWLERAGFRPGTHVQVRCLASGVIELRTFDKAAQPQS